MTDTTRTVETTKVSPTEAHKPATTEGFIPKIKEQLRNVKEKISGEHSHTASSDTSAAAEKTADEDKDATKGHQRNLKDEMKGLGGKIGQGFTKVKKSIMGPSKQESDVAPPSGGSGGSGGIEAIQEVKTEFVSTKTAATTTNVPTKVE
jgi:hypothetical protein